MEEKFQCGFFFGEKKKRRNKLSLDVAGRLLHRCRTSITYRRANQEGRVAKLLTIVEAIELTVARRSL